MYGPSHSSGTLKSADNSTTLTDSHEILEQWKEHFSTLLNHPSTAAGDDVPQQPEQPWMAVPPTYQEFSVALSRLEPRKALGPHLELIQAGSETLVSRVLTECINSRIFLNKSSISLEDTFLGMKRIGSLSIHNGSDFMVYFKWRKMSSEVEECTEKFRLKSAYALVQEMETKKSFSLETFGIIDHESHENVYSRIYDDEIKALKNEEFLFSHHSFSIFPLSGEIWPHGHADITVVFEPDLAMTHTAKAYCDVTGREKRLPLLMTAVGLGPKIALNMTSLDTDYICLSATHCYQVVAKNIGLIPGTIHYIPSEVRCGGTISCSPETHHLNPEELGTFILTFSTSVHGKFKEDILFTIIESSEIIELHFLGKTVSPTLTFDVKFIDIGEVAFGFPTDVSLKMQNLSVVPVDFKLSVLGDGFEPSLTYKEYGALKIKPSLPVKPREFTVQPKEGVMEPYSCVKVMITLIPNVVHSHEVVLKAEIRDSQSGPVLVPITYAVKFPEILCYPSDINIRFCFINYPYTRSLVLENVSLTPGFFYIVPQQVTSFTSMTVSTPCIQGILKPKSKMKIPLTIMTNQLGKQSVSMSMIVFGEDKPKVICNLVCNGQGPVVSVDPHQLNFGEVRLLEEVSMELTLTNDSPVPADFMASIGKTKSPWKTSPQKGVLYAEESITLQITVELYDTGTFTDFVQIQVHNSRTLIVNMSAVGIGTSLVVEPPISPEYKLGALFT
ncbi:hydrocephalus-inducing protein homolog [Anabrus simplex]|uniref:hydrocephalus-inducing protein homolog n=1 Tax=Anabrus simplex TaxID=316456 RepID=UPI0035A2C42E